MHEICFASYSEKTKKQVIVADCNEQAERYSDSRGGLYEPIEFKENLILEDEDAARKWIDEHDRSYWNVAVKFRHYKDNPKSKKLDTLKIRCEKEREKSRDYSEAHAIKNFKSALVGCPKCNSKLNKNYIHRDSCPLCGQDLRSKTTIDTLAKYDANIKDLLKQIKEEERKLNQKRQKQAEIKWLVKYEYHV